MGAPLVEVITNVRSASTAADSDDRSIETTDNSEVTDGIELGHKYADQIAQQIEESVVDLNRSSNSMLQQLYLWTATDKALAKIQNPAYRMKVHLTWALVTAFVWGGDTTLEFHWEERQQALQDATLIDFCAQDVDDCHAWAGVSIPGENTIYWNSSAGYESSQPYLFSVENTTHEAFGHDLVSINGKLLPASIEHPVLCLLGDAAACYETLNGVHGPQGQTN